MIADIEAIDEKVRVGGRAKPRMSHTQVAALTARRNDLLARYFAILPSFVLSRCPHCDVPLTGTLDPWGFDGPWWQEVRGGQKPSPVGCEHFRVLTGAVALADARVTGGSVEAHIGADAPFVIPVVLDQPTMIAVVSCISIFGGHHAYPIAYFSSQPPKSPALANPWTRTSCTYIEPGKGPSFAYKTDPWDFNLKPWIDARKLRWLDPDKPDAPFADDAAAPFPFVVPNARHIRQIVVAEHYLTRKPPHGEKIEPFGD